MANTTQNLAADTWTLVASNTTKQVIVPNDSTPNQYIYTAIPQGDDAPTDETTSLRLPLGIGTEISDNNPIDIYVKAKGAAGTIILHADITETVAQDNTSPIIDIYLSQKLKEDIVLTAPTTIGTEPGNFVLNVSAGHGFITGSWLEIWEGGRFSQTEVVSVATNAITVALPIERVWTTSAVVRRVNVDMDVDGSLTPVKFTFAPLGTTWDIIRFILNMSHTSAGADDLFGSLTALGGGVYARRKNTAVGTFGNLFNAKSNADFRDRSFNLTYSDKAGPSTFGTNSRRTFNGNEKNGAAIRIRGGDLEEIEAWVRDNIEALVRFRIVIQGSLITN